MMVERRKDGKSEAESAIRSHQKKPTPRRPTGAHLQPRAIDRSQKRAGRIAEIFANCAVGADTGCAWGAIPQKAPLALTVEAAETDCRLPGTATIGV